MAMTFHTTRRANYLVLLIFLAGLAVGLGVLLFVVVRSFSQADDQTRRLLGYLAWSLAAMLALTALMLVWIFVRYMRCRYAPDGRPRSCGYVDAWSEAGKRIQLDEEDNRDDDADDHHRPPPGDPSMN